MNMRVWAAGMMAALVLSGCGGGTTTASEDGEDTATPTEQTTASTSEEATDEATEVSAALTADEWVDQALVECEAVNEATAAAEPKGDPFGPKATKEDREQAVTFLTTFADSLRTFAVNLEELGYPEEGAEEAEGLVTAAESSAESFDSAAQTAEQDFAKAQGAVGQAFGSLNQVTAAAKKVGIEDIQNCKRDKKTAAADPDANQVPVVATKKGDKYVFEFDKTVAAGKTAFVLDNEDDEPHFMAFVQLTRPGTLQKALQAQAQGDSKEADTYIKSENVGGSEEAAPGEQTVANVELKPGTYGMLCFIPGPDGKPHAFNGMAIEFEAK